MSTLRILHISDLHASTNQDWSQRLIVDELVKDLKPFQAERPCDFVVFTGDLANSGTAEELAAANKLLLVPLMQAVNLGADRMVIVPGNHDIERARIKKVYEAGLENLLTDRDAVNNFLLNEDPSPALQRLTEWKAFSDGFYEGVARSVQPLAWTTRLTVKGVAVGVVALNSAWRSTGAGPIERGRLLLGEPQVHTAVESTRDADIRLVALHHPLAWLQQFDHDDARMQLERIGAIVLTGHEHENDPYMGFTTRGSAIYSRAGCLYQTRNYRNSYSIIDIDLSAREANFTLREWIDGRHTFDVGVDLAQKGSMTVPLPHRQGDLGVPLVPFTQVTGSLVELFQRSAVVGDLLHGAAPSSLGDILVVPRLYPVPYGEVAAARVAEKGRKISPVDPASLLADRVIIITGEPGSGVTATLLWLIERQFSTDGTYLPLYTRFSARQGKRVLDDDLRESAVRVGVRLGPDHPLPKAAVAIDDIILDQQRAVDRLASFIKVHPDNTFILGCHGDNHAGLERALEEVGITPRRLFLGQLGRKETKHIAAKMSGGEGADLSDRVLSVLTEKRLPRTPFLVVTLTAVLAERPETVVLNATAVVDAYVSLLLGRMEFTALDAMDFRGREHLLEYIAGELTRTGQERLERLRAEQIAADYFANRRLHGASPGRVVDDLIGRRILIDEGGYVAFRHPTLLHLFAAKLMADSSQFSAEIVAKPVKYGEIVLHAAALSRANRDLLATVGLAARPLIDQGTKEVTQSKIDAIFATGNPQTDVNNLDQALKRTAPLPDEVIDAIMDEYYERVGDRSTEPRKQVETYDGDQLLWVATALLSEVLVSSELVDDIPLRVDLLKQAIRGWSSAAISLLRREESEGTFRKVFERVFLKEKTDDDTRASLDRLVGLVVVIYVAIVAVGTLGKTQIRGLLSEVLADKEFTASAIYDLIATFLAVTTRVPGWPSYLLALRDAHGNHQFVADFVHNLALNRYQWPETTDAEASVLKKYLTDDILSRSRAPGGVLERQALRSQVDSQLQKTRTQMKLKGLPADILIGEVPEDTDSPSADSNDEAESPDLRPAPILQRDSGLTSREVEHVARLARLGITEEEVVRYRDQLRHILSSMDALKRTDTSNVPATAHPLEERNVMRDDRTEPCLPAEAALQNAPSREGPYFKVKAIQE